MATRNHPFYVKNVGWIQAEQLKVNDQLLNYAGEILKVENIVLENREIEVYNFEVEGNHNYYISNLDILVHNKCDVQKINDSYLKKKGIDAHEFKRDYLGNKAKIAQYDLYVDKVSGEILIYKKGGIGTAIQTGEFIK